MSGFARPAPTTETDPMSINGTIEPGYGALADVLLRNLEPAPPRRWGP